jgi:hypothetical protein
MLPFFENIVAFLNKEEIPYMLTGSMAMSLYTVSRATKDFDFIVNISKDDISKIIVHFKEGYYCNEDAIRDAVRYKSMFNIIEHNSGFKVDFFVSKDSPFQQSEFSRRSKVHMFGVDVFVISLEDLILSKLNWIQQLQSAIQIQDIRTLTQLEDIDWGYIHHWVDRLNLATFDLIAER